MPEENLEQNKLERKLTDFDSDFLPSHLSNTEAAKQRDLVYNYHKKSYVDEDGCLIRDKFGQPF